MVHAFIYPAGMACPAFSWWLRSALVAALLAMTMACPASAGQAREARGGVIDLSGRDFARDGPAMLDGEWEFFANRMILPGDSGAVRPSTFALVPGAWTDVLGASKGFGSYRLRVDCDAQSPDLALAVPFEHTAMTVYVNGRLVSQQGRPGSSPQQHQPQLNQQIVRLEGLRCPLQVVAQLSNFEVQRGGMVRSIRLGTHAQLLEQREGAITRTLLALGSVLVLGLLSLVFYLWRRQDRVPLFFGLYSLTLGISLGLIGERPLQPYVAWMSMEGEFRLLYVDWFFNLCTIPLFLRSLYPREVSAAVTRAVAVFSACGALLALSTPIRIFVYSTTALQAGAVAIAIYAAFALVLAMRHRQRGAGILLAGLGTLVVAVAHDVIFFQHLLSSSLLPFGVFGLVLAPAILLAQRFARALAAEESRTIEQRGRTDLLMRATKAGLLDWDAVNDKVHYSERYKEMFGYPIEVESAALPSFSDMLHPDDREHTLGRFSAQLRERDVRDAVRHFEPLDYRMRRADGEYIWVHAEGIGTCGADGRTLRFVCSFIDISLAKRHEIEMSNRMKFINDLFDSVPLSLALRDPEGRYLYVNRAWERDIGLPRESVIGASLRGVSDPAAEMTLALDREALDLGPGASIPAREYDYNGRRFMQTRTVMVDAQGVQIGVLAASLDITDKFAVEQALATERERLSLLVRSTKAGFGDWDAVRNVVTYSGRFKEMLGYESDADTSDWPSIFDMMHPEDSEPARAQFKAMIRRKDGPGEQEPGAPMSYRLRRRDGTYVWIHAEGISQVDPQGRTRRFITSYLDVTAFREQEEALRRQVELTRTEQKRLDLVVRGARVGIVDWDGRTHETYYSPRFREILGHAPDADTSAWPDYFKVLIHPEDRDRVTRRWTKFIMGKGPEGPHGEHYAAEEYRMLRADGGYAWVQASGMAVRDEQGFVLRWIAAIIDITERRAQQEALRVSHDQVAAQAALLEQQNEALKENVRLREEVERIGRHDIKTPLNSIVAVPRLLREERKLGPEADELLSIVERAGYRILSMVNLSLDLYKMEQGTYVFRPDAVDLADLLNKIGADVRMHAASKQVRLKVDVAAAPYAWAEELLCYSLLANLLKNAVEASPEGAVVTVTAAAAQNDTVVLHIHNRGVVPESVRGNFFEKYATLGKASGTGLGTYSARLMARIQDGDIDMETSEAHGTVLSIRLRAAPAGAMPATVRHAAQRGGLEPVLVSALPPTRVLLVDDDEYNLLILRRFLPDPPFTVDTAINGRVALAAAELQWPDVIFMDLDMPVMGGLQAVQELRAMERAALARRCTMIALSSHEDDDTRARSLAAGFDRYLTKPVTRDMIHETLLELYTLIGEARAPASPRVAPSASRDDAVFADADVQPLLAEFIESRRTLIGEMAQAGERGRRDEVRRIAHQLAGSFALYGFLWAGEQCRWIEGNFSDVPPARLHELVRELLAHVENVEIRWVGGADAAPVASGDWQA
jgi:PAS domain S-box-containing protein